jgi:hypothetical protein
VDGPHERDELDAVRRVEVDQMLEHRPVDRDVDAGAEAGVQPRARHTAREHTTDERLDDVRQGADGGRESVLLFFRRGASIDGGRTSSVT